jgi:hypothetical protein
MYSAAYQTLAARLAESLKLFGLHFAIYEVPGVHKSISVHGIDDLGLTKAALIRFAWKQHARPVLYLDCDVIVRQPPMRVVALVTERREFAIYNWLADESTDCFQPFSAQGLPEGRFYRFTHSIDFLAPEQLMCSGATQYWAQGVATERLLDRWITAQRNFPRAADDPCLDHAFNSIGGSDKPSYAWFNKAYARYAWWPHVKPVLDHPQFPSSGSHFERVPRQPSWTALWEPHSTSRLMPRDCLLDVIARRVYKVQKAPNSDEATLVDIGGVDAELFIGQ